MTTVATSSEFVVQRCTCFDCKKAHSCVEAGKIAAINPKELLRHTCKKQQLGHPQDTKARLAVLRSLGVLALRAITQRHKLKEVAVTREERQTELNAMNRLDLRKKALEAGFPPTDSVRADSEVLKAFILDKEFPQAAEEPKTTGRKRAPAKKTEEAPAPEPAAAAGGDAIDALGQVLDSHGAALDTHTQMLEGIVKMLHTFMCLVAEPELADEAAKAAGLGDIVVPPQ